MTSNQCPRCTFINRPGAKFCAHCCQPLTPPPPVVQAGCIRCGQPLRANAQFCAKCGARQIVTLPPLPVQPPMMMPAVAPVLRPPALPPPPPVIELPPADYRQAMVEIDYTSQGRFGLKSKKDGKKLTFSDTGGTNNTRVWIDGDTPIYGDGGRWLEAPQMKDGRLTSVWKHTDIEVAQIVSYVYGMQLGRVDTIQIKYTLTNVGRSMREVGLRIMIDTLIGDNDGVPFVVPGHKGIVTEALEFTGAQVPESFQALEEPDLAEPGVIVRMRLQGGETTRPDRLVITHWPGSSADWNFPLTDLGHDSAVGLYYEPRSMARGESRTIVTCYGLGEISSAESGNACLSLSFERAVELKDKFWITALVIAPHAGQTACLALPAGLDFSDGYEPRQDVTLDGEYTQVSWRVVAQSLFDDDLVQVTLEPDGITESQSISVRPRGSIR